MKKQKSNTYFYIQKSLKIILYCIIEGILLQISFLIKLLNIFCTKTRQVQCIYNNMIFRMKTQFKNLDLSDLFHQNFKLYKYTIFYNMKK